MPPRGQTAIAAAASGGRPHRRSRPRVRAEAASAVRGRPAAAGPARASSLAATAIVAVLLGVRPAAAQEVEVVLERFGVGSVYRPGDFAGIEVTLRDRRETGAGDARNALVQWEVVNADGDVAEHVRLVGGLVPGGVRRSWLYAPLPPDTTEESVFRIRVFVEEDGARGRELGGTRISPVMAGADRGGSQDNPVTSEFVEARTPIFAIVGEGTMGLRGYEHLQASPGGEATTSHESPRVLNGVRIESLPDHHLGLDPFDLVVFAPNARPQELDNQQSAALREWVRGGGHLVLVLEPNDDAWGIGRGREGGTAFFDLLPARAPTIGDATLQQVLPALSRSEAILGARANDVLQVAVFDEIRGPSRRLAAPWEPLLALPDGRVFTVERRFGHGRITLVGLDLTSPRFVNLGLDVFQAVPGGGLAMTTRTLPEADVFWNPILGRRGDSPSPQAIEQLAAEGRLRRSPMPEVLVGGAETILGDIEMAEDAEKGLLMALVLFVAYWFVAGPLGFLWLRSQGRVKQAWLGFAASAAIFTFLAWGGVGLIRKRETDLRHLTFLDHVHRGELGEANDPQLSRATSWMTLYLPGYGGETLALEADDTAGTQRQLHVRMPPGAQSRPFPNASRYRVETASETDAVRLPSRSTTTTLRADWLGVVPADWGGFFEVDVDDPVRVEVGPDNRERLRGSLVSRLPDRLVEVMIVFVHARRIEAAPYVVENGRAVPRIRLADSGAMSHFGDLWRLGADGWMPQAKLDLSTLDGTSRLASSLDRRYVEPFEQDRGRGGFGMNLVDRGERRRLQEMLGVFDQLTPPTWMRDAGEGAEEPTARFVRLLGRDIDLSDWLSRPCLIVVGRLEDAALPLPLTAGGDPVEAEGDVIVRWIHPLPQAPPRAFENVFRSPAAAGGDSAASASGRGAGPGSGE